MLNQIYGVFNQEQYYIEKANQLASTNFFLDVVVAGTCKTKQSLNSYSRVRYHY